MSIIQPTFIKGLSSTSPLKAKGKVPYMQKRKQIVEESDKKSMDALKWLGLIAAGSLAVGGIVYSIKSGKKPNIDKITPNAQDAAGSIQNSATNAIDKSVKELSVADKYLKSQLEEKIADGQISNLADALGLGYTEVQIKTAGLSHIIK